MTLIDQVDKPQKNPPGSNPKTPPDPVTDALAEIQKAVSSMTEGLRAEIARLSDLISRESSKPATPSSHNPNPEQTPEPEPEPEPDDEKPK